MVYRYSLPDYNPGADAGTVGAELERIEAANGELTKQNVLDAARPQNAPLHPCFEWDDNVAAEKYRLSQAGKLIRFTVAVHENGTESKAFLNVSHGYKTSRFINFRDVMRTDAYRAAVLANAKSEARIFRDKYKELTELSRVFLAIDELG